jgi:hypothetical protein
VNKAQLVSIGSDDAVHDFVHEVFRVVDDFLHSITSSQFCANLSEGIRRTPGQKAFTRRSSS